MPALTPRPPSKSRPRPRRNAELTRNRLCDVAIELFAARGYDGVSVDEIVAQAGVDKALVYHYFKGKADLYRNALQEVYRRPDAAERGALETGQSTREKLTHLLHAMAHFLEDHPEYVRMLLWENLGKGRHIRKHQHLLGKSFLPHFERIIADGIAAGELRADLVPAHLFINFVGLFFVYHSNRYTLAHELGIDLGDRGVRAEGIRQAVRLVFQGIQCR